MTTSRWPDTTRLERPAVDSPWHRARWLVGRYPVLAQLLARVPDVIDWRDDGPWVELEALGSAINAFDAYQAAWEDYRKRTLEPREEGLWGAWNATGPSPESFAAPGVVHSIAVMSRTEQARLRLLATVGCRRVGFSIDDLWGFDEGGRRLIRDWCSLAMNQ